MVSVRFAKKRHPFRRGNQMMIAGSRSSASVRLKDRMKSAALAAWAAALKINFGSCRIEASQFCK